MSAKRVLNSLQIEFFVLTPKIKQAEDLHVKAVFTNTGTKPLRLDTLFLELPVILLKIRHLEHDKQVPILLGPPPLPPPDDGKTGRQDLQPGDHLDFEYTGGGFFGGRSLVPGKYEIRYRYENQSDSPEDWKGLIETDWVSFEVAK